VFIFSFTYEHLSIHAFNFVEKGEKLVSIFVPMLLLVKQIWFLNIMMSSTVHEQLKCRYTYMSEIKITEHNEKCFKT